MNRRNFLKLNATLSAGLLLPQAVFSQKSKCSRSYYSGTIKPDDSKEYWSLSGYICEKMTMDFDNANDQDKLFDLNVRYYKKGLSGKLTKKGKYVFQITNIKTNTQTKTATCKAKFKSMDQEGYSFPKKMFNKRKITLSILTSGKKRIITISSKKGELANISRTISSSSSSGSGGCYLTTACTQYQGLEDNCLELQTLRSLRENFMQFSSEGKVLLQEYDALAPDLVKRINSFENSAEIYTHMYLNMILPSVGLIQSGHKNEAMELYKAFSNALYQKYSKPF